MTSQHNAAQHVSVLRAAAMATTAPRPDTTTAQQLLFLCHPAGPSSLTLGHTQTRHRRLPRLLLSFASAETAPPACSERHVWRRCVSVQGHTQTKRQQQRLFTATTRALPFPLLTPIHTQVTLSTPATENQHAPCLAGVQPRCCCLPSAVQKAAGVSPAQPPLQMMGWVLES